MLFELQTALLSHYLDSSCAECPRPKDHCSLPHGLDRKGGLRINPYPEEILFARWPACPHSFDPYYHVGYSVERIDSLIRFELEKGTHRLPNLTSGVALLFRRYLALSSGTPQGIQEIAESVAYARRDS